MCAKQTAATKAKGKRGVSRNSWQDACGQEKYISVFALESAAQTPGQHRSSRCENFKTRTCLTGGELDVASIGRGDALTADGGRHVGEARLAAQPFRRRASTSAVAERALDQRLNRSNGALN